MITKDVLTLTFVVLIPEQFVLLLVVALASLRMAHKRNVHASFTFHQDVLFKIFLRRPGCVIGKQLEKKNIA